MKRWPLIHLSSEKMPRRRSAGFTLIEILVAISIIAILMSAIYGIFTSVSVTKDRLDADSEAYHRARVIFDRLGREIRGAYVNPDNDSTLFRGGETSEGGTFLELSTTAVSPLSSEGTGFALVRYALEDDREADDGSKVLLRMERPLLAGENINEQTAMRLAPGISVFRVRFYRDAAWHDNWDAATDGLPALVEVSLVTADGNDQDVPFLTAFDLPVLRPGR